MTRLVAALAAIAVCGAPALALADDPPPGSIIFARAGALFRSDPHGRGETKLVELDPKQRVRALATDAAGKVLLADLDGAWAWMRLDGSASALAPLPCAAGPAALDEDGTHVICRGAHGTLDIDLAVAGKPLVIDAPVARIVGTGANRRFMWADGGGVWSAPPSARPRAKAQKVAPEPPLRSFLPSPDGTRAVGVYTAEVYTDAHHKQPADVLVGFQLDGVAARRKAIKDGVPLEWSHDGQWVLVQDAASASACLMRATGGEYKCWRGYIAAAISPDGKFGLVLGSAQAPANPKRGERPAPADSDADDAPTDDVALPPPTGPLSLYLVRLEGSPFTEPPALVAHQVDGAAVWVP